MSDKVDALLMEASFLKEEIRRLKDEVSGNHKVMAERLQIINDYKRLTDRLEEDADFLASALSYEQARYRTLQRKCEPK